MLQRSAEGPLAAQRQHKVGAPLLGAAWDILDLWGLIRKGHTAEVSHSCQMSGKPQRALFAALRDLNSAHALPKSQGTKSPRT